MFWNPGMKLNVENVVPAQRTFEPFFIEGMFGSHSHLEAAQYNRSPICQPLSSFTEQLRVKGLAQGHLSGASSLPPPRFMLLFQGIDDDPLVTGSLL